MIFEKMNQIIYYFNSIFSWEKGTETHNDNQCGPMNITEWSWCRKAFNNKIRYEQWETRSITAKMLSKIDMTEQLHYKECFFSIAHKKNSTCRNRLGSSIAEFHLTVFCNIPVEQLIPRWYNKPFEFKILIQMITTDGLLQHWSENVSITSPVS